jgi:hypothetical protein
MATSKQENLYNEIVEYYNFADKLIDTVENGKDNIPEKQIEAVETIVENLEKYADQLSSQFVEFVKNGNSHEVISDIRQALNSIISNIEECRNKIYLIYSDQSGKK